MLVCQSVPYYQDQGLTYLFVAGDSSVEEEKVSWEDTDHVQHKCKSPENSILSYLVICDFEDEQ